MTKKFHIVNTTHSSWSFEWTKGENVTEHFKCSQLRGVFQAGKRNEISFEYSSSDLGNFEENWYFKIAEHDVCVSFLLSGSTVEPNVFFEKSVLLFNQGLVGRQFSEQLKIYNNEKKPFLFALELVSNYRNSEPSDLSEKKCFICEPSSGTLPAQSYVDVLVTFKPSAEREYNTQLKCLIKQRAAALLLPIRAKGYKVMVSLWIETGNNEWLEFYSKQRTASLQERRSQINKNIKSAPSDQNEKVTTLALGRHLIGDKIVRKIKLENTGSYGTAFTFKVLKKYVRFSIMSGNIAAGQTLEMEAIIFSQKDMLLKSTAAICTINNGPSYPIEISGQFDLPMVQILPEALEFGSVFIQQDTSTLNFKTTENAKELVLKNQEVYGLNIEISLPKESCFELETNGNFILNPGQSKSIKVTFCPVLKQIYKDKIRIEINSCYEHYLPLSGDGCELDVKLVRQEQRELNLGSLRVGQSSQHSVKLYNSCNIGLNAVLGPPDTLLALENVDVTINPKTFYMSAHQTASIQIDFHPKKRFGNFSRELVLSSGKCSKNIMQILGASLGVDFRLDSETMPFGPVTCGGSLVKKVTLKNFGDLGAAYNWCKTDFLPEFSITPTSGYLPPGMESTLEITFQPFSVQAEIRNDSIKCLVEGIDIPIFLSLSGSCVPLPAYTETIKFSAPVRQSEVRGLQLINKSSCRWTGKAIIDSKVWTGPDNFTVEPLGTFSYPVKFSPTEMGKEYSATVFFPMSDGTGVIFKLIGSSEKPLAIATLDISVSCKSNDIQYLRVRNWLKKTQRFKIVMEQPGNVETSVVLKGHEYIEVSGDGERDYKMHFYAFKECNPVIHVIFINEETSEYQYYILQYHVSPPNLLETFKLHTSVRQPVTKILKFSNPLNALASFSATTNAQDITITPCSFNVGTGDIEVIIEYLPLQTRDVPTSTRIQFTSSELGIYIYDAEILALPANPEKAILFKVALGSQITQSVKIIHYCRSKTEFSARLEHPDFVVEKPIIATPAQVTISPSVQNPPSVGQSPIAPANTTQEAAAANSPNSKQQANTGGTTAANAQSSQSTARPNSGKQTPGLKLSAANVRGEMTLDISYEPSAIGNASTILYLTSPMGGDYVIPLIGNCTAPKAQGPIIVKMGTQAQVGFKNVFAQAAQYAYTVDNPWFTVKSGENIPAKKTVSIIVTYKPPAASSATTGGTTTTFLLNSEGSSNEKENSASMRPGSHSGYARAATAQNQGLKESSTSGSGQQVGLGTSSVATLNPVQSSSGIRQAKLSVIHTSSGTSWTFYIKGVPATVS